MTPSAGLLYVQAELCNKRLGRAGKLTNLLGDELVRWAHHRQQRKPSTMARGDIYTVKSAQATCCRVFQSLRVWTSCRMMSSGALACTPKSLTTFVPSAALAGGVRVHLSWAAGWTS